MRLFSKKSKVNYNDLFKQKYKHINQLSQQAHNEIDYVIKQSLWQSVVNEYEELIKYIELGANYDKDHFNKLLDNARKELETVKGINNDL